MIGEWAHELSMSFEILLKNKTTSLDFFRANRPFAGSGHMVRNKICWDARYAVELSKQRKVVLSWYEFVYFGSPTV